MDVRKDRVERAGPNPVFSSQPAYTHGACEAELAPPSPDPSCGLIPTTNNPFHGAIHLNHPTGADQLSRNAADSPFHVDQSVDLDGASNHWAGASAVDEEIQDYTMKWAPSLSNDLHDFEDFSVPTTTGPDVAVLLGPMVSAPWYVSNDAAGWTMRSYTSTTGTNVFNNGTDVAFDDHLAPTNYDSFDATCDPTNSVFPFSTNDNTINGFQYGIGTTLNNMPSRMMDNVFFNQPSAAAAVVPVPVTSRSTKRFRCIFPGCGCTFTQNSDLSRHARKHEPDAKRHECWARGCTRNGKKGFLRRDKLQSHQRNMHGMES